MNQKILTLVLVFVLMVSTVVFPLNAFADSVLMQVDIGDVGNVFFGKENGVDISVHLTNFQNSDIDATVQVLLYNDRGVLLDNISKDILIEADSVYHETISLAEVCHYGYHDITVKVINRQSGQYIASYQTEFTIVNTPDSDRKNAKLGVVIHERQDSFGDPLVNLNFADKAGFANVRTEQLWENYETEKNVYAFTDRYQQFLNKEQENGMGHLEILSYGNKLYADSFPPKGETELAAFRAYAKSIVGDLLKKVPDGKLEVELWNEWNNFDKDGSTWDQFNPRNLDVYDYAAFCKAVYPAIKEAAKEAGVDVWVWGMAACGITWNSFIPYALEAGAGKYMDGISLHPYSNQECPEDFLAEDMEWLYQKINDSHDSEIKFGNTVIREENFDLALKDNLRASEFGWPGVGGSYPDEEGQASYFVRFNVLNEQNGYFKKLDYYTINDGGIGTNIEQNFGLIRSKNAKIPYQPKPAYLAAANYNALMSDATYVKSVAISSEITAYQFRLADGKDLVVAWKIHDSSQVNTPNAADTQNAALKLGADSVTVIDMYGNEQLVEGNGTYGFTFDKKPIYIVGNFSSLSTGAYKDSVVNVNNVIYDENKQTLFVDGESKKDVTIRIVKDGETVMTLRDRVNDGYYAQTISVGSLEDGEYRIVVGGGNDTQTVNTFQKVSRDCVKKQSSFAPGVIAVYDPSTNMVTLNGKVANWTEGETITIVCASVKEAVDNTPNKYNGFGGNAINTIIYMGETTVHNGAFEKSFVLPANADGTYIVRCGGTYITDAEQTNVQNADKAIVCTFTADKSASMFSASALLKNASATKDIAVATLVIVQYDGNGKITAMDADQYSMKKGASELTPAVLSLPLEEDTVLCKAFIWDGTFSLVPLVHAIEIK